MRENVVDWWDWKKRLSDSVYNLNVFEIELKKAMQLNVSIPHVISIRVRICDHTDVVKDATLTKLLSKGIDPSYGRLLVFGAFEEWNERQTRESPTRQILFIVSSNLDVFAYEDEVLFFVAPSFDVFWTVPITFNWDNVIYFKTCALYDRDCAYERCKLYYEKVRKKGVFMTHKLPKKLSPLVTSEQLNGNLKVILAHMNNTSHSKETPSKFKKELACKRSIVSRETQTENVSEMCVFCGHSRVCGIARSTEITQLGTSKNGHGLHLRIQEKKRMSTDASPHSLKNGVNITTWTAKAPQPNIELSIFETR